MVRITLSPQIISTDLDFRRSSKRASPTPTAAGIPISAQRIAIWEFDPPNFVINPAIPLEKIQSNPGSALSMQTILPLNFRATDSRLRRNAGLPWVR